MKLVFDTALNLRPELTVLVQMIQTILFRRRCTRESVAIAKRFLRTADNSASRGSVYQCKMYISNEDNNLQVHILPLLPQSRAMYNLFFIHDPEIDLTSRRKFR